MSLFLLLYLSRFFAVGSWPVRYFVRIVFIPSVNPAMVVQLSMYGLAMSGSVLFIAYHFSFDSKVCRSWLS